MIRLTSLAFAGSFCLMVILFSTQTCYSHIGCANQACNRLQNGYVCVGLGGSNCDVEGNECESTPCPSSLTRAGLLPLMPPGVSPHPDPELAELLARCSAQRSDDDTGTFRLRPMSLDVSLSGHAGDDGISRGTGTGMRLLFPTRDAPLVLLAATHGLDDVFVGGKVMSYTTKPIVGYRVGWAFNWGTKIVLEEGDLISVKGGIQPGFSSNVPDQHALPFQGSQHPQTIGFFVSEVRYSDGGVWRLDKKLLAQQLN